MTCKSISSSNISVGQFVHLLLSSHAGRRERKRGRERGETLPAENPVHHCSLLRVSLLPSHSTDQQSQWFMKLEREGSLHGLRMKKGTPCRRLGHSSPCTAVSHCLSYRQPSMGAPTGPRLCPAPHNNPHHANIIERLEASLQKALLPLVMWNKRVKRENLKHVICFKAVVLKCQESSWLRRLGDWLNG